MSDGASRRRRSPALRWLLRIAVVVAISSLFIYVNILRNRDRAEVREEIKLPVVVSKPERRTITQALRIGSYVESEQVVTVLPKASGTLTTLSVDVGDFVREGQVIAQIDSEPYRLALSQAETARDAAQSAYERAQTLHEVGSVSDQTLEQAKTQLDAAQSQYESAELSVRNTTIRSPVTGSVVARHRSAGALVGSQVPVVTISSTQDLIISAEVPEQYIAEFVERRAGIAVRVSLPAIDRNDLPAWIKFVSPYIRPETRTFRVACEIGGNTTSVLPGMYVELDFILAERRDVLVLPYDALVAGTTLWFVEGEPPLARSFTFEPEFSNEELFQLPDEYAERRFVIDGQHFLSEGLPVRIVGAQPEDTE